MSRILDPKFKYRPSWDTNVKRTIKRIQRAQKEAAKPDARVRVLQLDQLKKAAR